MGLLLEVKGDLSSSLQSGASGILNNGEGLGVRLPDMLATIIILGGDNNLVSDQEGGVEADTELANQVAHLTSRGSVLELTQKLGGAGFGDCSQVVNEILLGHSDTSIRDVQDLVLLVRLDFDCELLSSVE